MKILMKMNFQLNQNDLLKLLNKCKFSVSNDETRHYLKWNYFHQTEVEDKNYLNMLLQLIVIECLFQK